MKILLVNKAYWPHLGGVETVVRQLAKGMRDRGHKVRILCFGKDNAREIFEGVEVYRVRPQFRLGSAPLGWSFLKEYYRLARWADIINLHSPNPMGELAQLLFPADKKTVVTYHGDAVRPRCVLPAYDALMKTFLRRCDAVVVSNPNLLRSSRLCSKFSKLSKLREPPKIIPLGIDISRFSTTMPADAETAVKHITRNMKGFRIMFSGRLVYYKGVEILLQAVARLNKCYKYGLPYSLLIVGEGSLKAKIDKFIVDNELLQDVVLIPHQPHEIYTALFKQVDCFVLPSLFPVEAFGIVLLEAMACGLPVVSTELGTGTSWVNQHGETGLVVPPGNPEELSNALKYLAEHPKERCYMGKKAKLRVADNFLEETMLNAYHGLYSALMGRLME